MTICIQVFNTVNTSNRLVIVTSQYNSVVCLFVSVWIKDFLLGLYTI